MEMNEKGTKQHMDFLNLINTGQNNLPASSHTGWYKRSRVSFKWGLGYDEVAWQGPTLDGRF